MTLADQTSLTLAFALGAIVAAVIIPMIIAWQRRRALGQQIYEDGPSTHANKQGTPTMGGIAFAAAAVVGALLSSDPPGFRYPLLFLVLAAALIGFADDYLILIRRRPLGLRARVKFALLLLVAIAFVAWQWEMQGHDFVLPQYWFGGLVPVPPWLWVTLAVCAIVGAANAVNLTDGLDGLATGTVIPVLLLLTYITGSKLCASVAGACAGFLYFNTYPARIFMGDTGSLALGALLGGLAIQDHLLLLLPVIGLVFVAEAISVMLQVASFKLTGKRIFKMSPLHHHFEMLGWPESRVTATFVATSFGVVFATWIGLLVARGSVH